MENSEIGTLPSSTRHLAHLHYFPQLTLVPLKLFSTPVHACLIVLLWGHPSTLPPGASDPVLVLALVVLLFVGSIAYFQIDFLREYVVDRSRDRGTNN